uniref:Auxin-responsive protein n=1 Tax=Rhizophora mucronata TaxID=61149 RepID=A0A2P2QTI5_RHIMU
MVLPDVISSMRPLSGHPWGYRLFGFGLLSSKLLTHQTRFESQVLRRPR